MSWWEYVVRTSGTSSPKAMDDATGIDAPSFSKWKNGQIPKAETVARFARAYDRPVLEAFVAAGFLTEAEAKVRPAAAPNYDQLSNDELLDLVRSRMREEVAGHAGRSPAMNEPGTRPGLSAIVSEATGGSASATERTGQRAARRVRGGSEGHRSRADQDAAETGSQDDGNDEPR